MANPMRLVVLSLALMAQQAWAQVTLPHDLQPNTKASASKVMENFRALETAIEGIGGCTATQQDNSVLIECADGSSGVLAGAGTVVLVPEGSATGETPTEEVTSGSITLVDGNGDYLAPYGGMEADGQSVIRAGSYFEVPSEKYDPENPDPMGEFRRLSVYFLNRADTQQVYVVPSSISENQPARFVYTEPDCAGSPHLSGYNGLSDYFYHWDGSYFTGPLAGYLGDVVYDVVVRSYRLVDQWDESTYTWSESACSNELGVTYIFTYKVIVELPAEWSGIVYPVDIHQQP